MLFDRIIEDSLSFIRRMLWSRVDDTIAQNPFQPTRSQEGEFGFIHLLEGRDTPRAVRTWMYSPRRKHLDSANIVSTSVPIDLHIYMDFLGPLPEADTPRAFAERERIEEQRQKGKAVNTHRLQILKASHFLNEDGLYDCDLIFWKEFDFYRPQEEPFSEAISVNMFAVHFTDLLALKCLNIASPLQLKTEAWASVVDEVITIQLA